MTISYFAHCKHWAEAPPGWLTKHVCPACWFRKFLAKHPECAPYIRMPEVPQ